MKASKFCMSVLLISLCLSACSVATMKNSWLDFEFKRKIQKIYIVGVTKEESHRRLLEDSFQKKFAEHNLLSVSSYHDLSGNVLEDQNHIVKGMTDNSCDVAILIKLVGTGTKEVAIPTVEYQPLPGYHFYWNNWPKYSIDRNRSVIQQFTVEDYKIALVDAVMYDLFKDKVFWSGQLEGFIDDNFEKMFIGFADQVVEDLKTYKLI